MEHLDLDNNLTIDSRDLAVVVYRKYEENAYYPDFELDLRLEEDEPEVRLSHLAAARLKEKIRLYHKKQDELLLQCEKQQRKNEEIRRQTVQLAQVVDNMMESIKLDHPEMIPILEAKQKQRELEAEQNKMLAKRAQNDILTEAIGAKTLKAAEGQPDETVFEPAQRGRRRRIGYKQTFYSETYLAVKEQLGDTAFKQVQTEHSVLKNEIIAEVLQAGANKPQKSLLQQVQVTYSLFSQAMNESNVINPTTVERENAGGDQADKIGYDVFSQAMNESNIMNPTTVKRENAGGDQADKIGYDVFSQAMNESNPTTVEREKAGGDQADEIVYDMLSERSTDDAAGDYLQRPLYQQMQKLLGILSQAVNDTNTVQVASPTIAEELQIEKKQPAEQSKEPKGLIPAAKSVADSGCLLS